MDGRMDGWMNEWMHAWMDGRMDGWMDQCQVVTHTVHPFVAQTTTDSEEKERETDDAYCVGIALLYVCLDHSVKTHLNSKYRNK